MKQDGGEDIRDTADAGDPRAQLALALKMLKGLAETPSPDEPLRLIQAACANDFDQALLYHAALAASGIARAIDLDEAYNLVVRAAALGNDSARGQVEALADGDGLDLEPWLAPPRLTQHADAPRVFTAEAFLPRRACEWLIAQARPKLERATVRHGTGESGVEGHRTNSASGSSMLQPDLVMQLARQRMAGVLGCSLMHLEPTNVLCYDVGQQFGLHYDFVRPDEAEGFMKEIETIGQRCATVLVYLNDNYEGGETDFPNIHFRNKGKAGDALIFWNLAPNGRLERDSMHAGLAVTAGQKWLLSQWVRERPMGLV